MVVDVVLAVVAAVVVVGAVGVATGRLRVDLLAPAVRTTPPVPAWPREPSGDLTVEGEEG